MFRLRLVFILLITAAILTFFHLEIWSEFLVLNKAKAEKLMDKTKEEILSDIGYRRNHLYDIMNHGTCRRIDFMNLPKPIQTREEILSRVHARDTGKLFNYALPFWY